ncbi:MAG: TVP38/TMEM64 family protein [Vicinamibacteria bacterium]
MEQLPDAASTKDPIPALESTSPARPMGRLRGLLSRRVGLLARVLLALEILVALGLMLRLIPAASWLGTAGEWLAGLGPLGPVLYAGLYAVGVVAFAPGSLLTLGAGLAFGPFWGFASASAGSTFGAGAAFLIGRHVARARVAARASADPRFRALDAAIARKGWRIVALTRLSPVLPFNALNYAYGLTGVRFGEYLLASWLAMAPGTLLFAYIGSLGRLGAAALAGSGADSYQAALNAVGVAATGAVTWIAARAARRAMREPAAAEAVAQDA